MIFTKKFEQDLDLIIDSVKNKKKFAFSKYADGELSILKNKQITNIDNWTFNPFIDRMFSNLLMESFKYNDEGYFIGISCPCCDPTAYRWFIDNKGSDNTNTTFANIFVNNNYKKFKDELLPLFNGYEKIYLIANKESNLLKIKEILNYTEFIGIGYQAFKTDLNLIEDLRKKIEKEEIKDSLFLFCAGPMGNVLSYYLWRHNKNNTYLDIGSTLNPWTEKNIRDYQKSSFHSNKICKFEI